MKVAQIPAERSRGIKHFLVHWVVLPLLVFTVLLGIFLALRAIKIQANTEFLAIDSPNGIQEEMYVDIGGIRQWLLIRGEDRDNPVILLLHGGPGRPTSPMAAWLKEWERYFTVVHWDQRGAGKTFSLYGDATPEMTPERLIADGYEVAEFVKAYLKADTLILVGHSYGAVLGLTMAKHRPGLFSAFVGTGQEIDPRRSEQVNYERLLSSAQAAGDQDSVETLQKIGGPPYSSLMDMLEARSVGRVYGSESERNYFWRTVGATLFSAEMSLADIGIASRGSRFSRDALYPGSQNFDARSYGLDFQIPVFFIQGARDGVTPSLLVEEYVRDIRAPHAEAIIIPEGGHNLMLAMPDIFLAALLERVMPVVIQRAGSLTVVERG